MIKWFFIIILLFVTCNLATRVDKLEQSHDVKTSYEDMYGKDTTIITRIEE